MLPGTGNSTGSADTSGLTALFPVPDSTTIISNWTTFSGVPYAYPLNNKTLGQTKVEPGMSHNFVQMDGKLAMEAHFPPGSYIPSKEPHGGFSSYDLGPDPKAWDTAKEAYFGYNVLFPTDFEFNKGGKLPGIYGGDNASTAVSCSGGRRDPTCFSVRLMWRTDGAGELYTYLPQPNNVTGEFSENEKLCADTEDKNECNPTYGASLGRGKFAFEPGAWTTVSQRVKLNTAGKADGELELFANGNSVIKVEGIIIRDSDEGRMRGIQMQTFFGGSTEAWASQKDQRAYFADFSVAITSTF
ncbi:hypothetical protein C8R46DRAFT_888895 [Mycena filopes]|nr:hypothetical protein C8R46DRAFT_888895 [Mycena filopes]